MNELNIDNFKTTIDSGLHVVDFWASWCGPCRMQAPILDELAQEYPASKVQFDKVNVDEEAELAGEYGVQSIPTLLVFSNGRLVDRLVGVQVKDKLEGTIQSFLEE
ncbi:thioredoxin [Tetragenococcus halophilus]|uniref:thioredoxin n=1 Tax=Tetragenococcus halophilus TaxID=51669 RepID=UPI0030C9CADB